MYLQSLGRESINKISRIHRNQIGELQREVVFFSFQILPVEVTEQAFRLFRA